MYVRIDGPLSGPSLDPLLYSNVVLVAGGVGITGVAALAERLAGHHHKAAAATALKAAASTTPKGSRRI